MSLNIENLRAGSHEVVFEAWDLFGRKKEQVVRFNVDNTPPVIRFIAPMPREAYRETTFEIGYEASDEGSGIAGFALSMIAPGYPEHSMRLPLERGKALVNPAGWGLGSGRWEFRLQAVDRAANAAHALTRCPDS